MVWCGNIYIQIRCTFLILIAVGKNIFFLPKNKKRIRTNCVSVTELFTEWRGNNEQAWWFYFLTASNCVGERRATWCVCRGRICLDESKLRSFCSGNLIYFEHYLCLDWSIKGKKRHCMFRYSLWSLFSSAFGMLNIYNLPLAVRLKIISLWTKPAPHILLHYNCNIKPTLFLLSIPAYPTLLWWRAPSIALGKFWYFAQFDLLENSNTISTQISSKAQLLNVLSVLAQVEQILCISSEVGNNYSW